MSSLSSLGSFRSNDLNAFLTFNFLKNTAPNFSKTCCIPSVSVQRERGCEALSSHAAEQLHSFNILAPDTCVIRTTLSSVSQHCMVRSSLANNICSCLGTPQAPENNEAFSIPNEYWNIIHDMQIPFTFENLRTSKSVCYTPKHLISEMKIQSKIVSTLKRNYRNTSMSSHTSKVFSDFKKRPRNLSEIMSSEKSPKSQRSSPQQICQGECFAPWSVLRRKSSICHSAKSASHHIFKIFHT